MNQTVIIDPFASESPGDFSGNVSSRAVMTEGDFVAWSKAHEKIHAEWINGEVILMSPVSARHVLLFVWLLNLLDSYVRRRGLGMVLGSEFVARLKTATGISRREPDIMFITRERQGRILKYHLEGPPDLAVEIVSPESIQRDWVEKLSEYEAAGVREYWIIDVEAQRFAAFRLGPDSKMISIYDQPSGTFESIVVAGLRFQVEWLWDENPPDQYEILKNLGVFSDLS